MTGVPPFGAEDPVAAAIATVLAKLRADVPSDIAALIASMMAKLPAARPRDAATLVARIDALGHGPHPSSPQTTFFARHDELQNVRKMLAAGTRLVTVVGPAGVGKTRLATELLEGWPEDTFFCDASPARDRGGLVEAIARSMGIAVRDGDMSLAIAERGEALFVIDNCEHVAADAAALLGKWLAGAALARFIVTSRERLRAPGEHVQDLQPLDEDDGE